ncbi:MAG: hypothetical protein Q7T20_01330 [Saprospiraceae bacterium]|nr:hypothetical protein [Saprospiraceae bacterium]
MQTINTAPPLNDVQLMLLRLFSRDMSKNELDAIRAMLLDYYDQALQEEVQKVIKEKKIERKDFEEKLNQQQRSR